MHRTAQSFFEDFVVSGLTTQAVDKAQAEGPDNSIASKPIPSDIYFFLAQFKSPLTLVLLIASLITAVLGEVNDTLVILGAVFLNAILGFYQERKAFKSMQAIKNVVSEQAWVFRNGKKIRIDSTTIVIGDVVLLYEGDKVPADGILVDASELVINEAVLTGESVPVAKSAFISKNKISDVSELISHLKNVSKTEQGAKVFLGTVVVSGLGSMVVTAIGMQTEMGHIARTIDEQTQKKTPLEKRIEDLARLITLTVVILSVTIFILGIVSGQSFSEMFIISVALAVSAIPEGLIVALTAILAIGMHRILQRKALVRNLVATETLGTVTRVCVDKTGTLTLGKLEVTDTAFTDDLLAYKTSILANELRDPLEFARWKWAESFARKHASKVKAPSVLQEEEKVDERIPFSSERRFLAVRVSSEIFMVGAPETIIKHTTLSDVAAKDSLKDVRLWAKKGRRIIALAYRKCASVEDAKKVFKQLAEGKVLRSKFRWLGLMGFTDPVRKSVKAALQQAASAGISVTVITGDYTETALAVMKELGMDVDENKVISGQELEAVSDASLLSQVQNIQLFARTKPSQKLRIVKALQARGEVVAMMGDGVNDAPAIAAAEIGLVVGDASDIARESADIVLLDSNFATILAAVEEGRGIFANLRKILLFLLSDTFSEVILIMGSLLMGLPLAITAAQVLWINIVNDVFPNLALTVDPKEKNLLSEPPIDPSEHVVNLELRVLITVISLITGLSTLAIFSWSLPRYGIDLARTLSFALLAIDSLVYVFSCRTVTMSVWKESLFTNKWLVLAVVVSGLATVLPIYLDPFQSFFSFVPLQSIHWIIVGVTSILVTLVIEVIKYIFFTHLLPKKAKV
ncbi:MAG: hypothetical protein CO156_01920 [Candidatus Pacebacteria bacterium CG_4_9_14_3_um_filter_40_12]|nr:MAG: hypothetical protein COU64_01095 [Candidatus Pacebacteria bacterium CG10_big_fil_rev_8_21_14_0_10_40_26]PIZ79620.1 MAG: hypothetical protein COY01_00670 [Candidatus Pacebacteria bacterium CG_4_10_14_0_2_um_filter_40_20]PJA69073.1 MAG: hypothetical protein CO156_01920 [Candidatus Pacebacteria bacterium CG_4_9_14_3_um_filter_40_12]PJC41793.1 MAG: hypothetical protein CO041_03685 [Candidatus Pacebacteria bacterium CG_4_9_14_0_2_um_filter_40_15]